MSQTAAGLRGAVFYASRERLGADIPGGGPSEGGSRSASARFENPHPFGRRPVTPVPVPAHVSRGEALGPTAACGLATTAPRMLQLRNLVLVLAAVSLSGSHQRGFDLDRSVSAEESAQPTASSVAPATIVAPPVMTPSTAPPGTLAGWKGDKADNICGIDDLKKVSNPAQVDYPDLMAATPQMKKIEKDGIDPDSAQGKLLRQEAVRLITKTCETIRRRKGYCGVWKEVAHKDKRSVPDVTSDVKAEMK